MHTRAKITDTELAGRYRRHSFNLRELSKSDCDLQTSEALRLVASRYERKADVLDTRAASLLTLWP